MSVSLVPAKSSGGLQPYEQIFTASGTWTKPAGVKTAEVTIVGASGGVNNSSAATSAGGYYKRVIDVSNMTSVAVTVGAGGGQNSAGGSSGFGSITCPGSIYSSSGVAGSWYDVGTPGVSYWQNLGQSYTGYYDVWYGAVNSWTYAKTANNGRVFVYGNGNGYNVTSPNGQGWAYMNSTVNGQGKIIYGNGVYIKFSAGSWTQSIEYSTDATSWQGMNIPGGYYKYGSVYGPAGFLIGDSGGGITKSTDGYNWSVVSTLSNSGNVYIEATSTHYYAFRAGQSICWRSTDGVTWETFSLPNTTQDATIYYGSYNNKVYFIQSNTLYEIDGTTVTNKGGTYYNFNHPGSPMISTSGGYQMLSNIGVTITNANFGGYGPAVVSSNGWVVAQSTGWGYYFTGVYAGYAGQSGTTSLIGNYQYYGSPGVTSTGSLTAGSYGAAFGIPGNGDTDGWGQGANYYNMAKTFGSGACAYPNGNNGNPGVVRVRWWA